MPEQQHADWATTRIGLAGHGVYYLLLTALIVQMTFGTSTKPGPGGALAAVARQPFGQALLIPLGLAFLAYAGNHAMAAWRADGAGERLVAAVRATVWFGLTALTAATAFQGASGSGGSSGSLTRRVMEAPGGPVLIGAVGVIVIGVAVRQGYHAQREGLGEELQQFGLGARRAVVLTGRVGHAGRALAYGLTGGFLVHSALTHDASEAGGLDTALEQVRDSSFGVPILLTVAAGFGAFGLFRIAEARYRQTEAGLDED